MQVVGRSCAVCGARIVAARDGRACATCGAALHDGCAAGHTCPGPQKAAAAPARAQPGAGKIRLIKIGAPVLGVLVAAAVVPRFRSWQAERRIAERAAQRLGCPDRQVEVAFGPGSRISARGCGASVTYLRVCGQDSPDCLEEIEPAARP